MVSISYCRIIWRKLGYFITFSWEYRASDYLLPFNYVLQEYVRVPDAFNLFPPLVTKFEVFEQGMPKKFLQKHGNDLSSLVFLKVPNGEIWPVQLERSDGRVLLGKGWLKFIDYYSIVPGQLILFRYEWNSIFQVVIFDTSSLEIEYPAICPKSKAEYEFPLPKKEETDDISVKISEECWPSQITSEKAKRASGEASLGLAGEDTNNSHKHLICTRSRSRGREFSSSKKNKPLICSSKNHEGVYCNQE